MHGMKKPPHSMPRIALPADATIEQRVIHRLRTVSHASKHLMFRRMADDEMHPGQALGLLVLARYDGMIQSELADVLGVARPTVTIMLQKMQRAGVIERRADENDQRNKRIYLTPQGRKVHEHMQRVHTGIVKDTLGNLSVSELEELDRLLTIIEGNITSAL